MPTRRVLRGRAVMLGWMPGGRAGPVPPHRPQLRGSPLGPSCTASPLLSSPLTSSSLGLACPATGVWCAGYGSRYGAAAALAAAASNAAGGSTCIAGAMKRTNGDGAPVRSKSSRRATSSSGFCCHARPIGGASAAANGDLDVKKSFRPGHETMSGPVRS
ncbi:hypothetical protein V8C86DRAFT_2509573, partial [Haematococcus lacustris]